MNMKNHLCKRKIASSFQRKKTLFKFNKISLLTLVLLSVTINNSAYSADHRISIDADTDTLKTTIASGSDNIFTTINNNVNIKPITPENALDLTSDTRDIITKAQPGANIETTPNESIPLTAINALSHGGSIYFDFMGNIKTNSTHTNDVVRAVFLASSSSFESYNTNPLYYGENNLRTGLDPTINVLGSSTGLLAFNGKERVYIINEGNINVEGNSLAPAASVGHGGVGIYASDGSATVINKGHISVALNNTNLDCKL